MSAGMLQNGPSRKFFEQWCSDKRNGVVLAGYCVEGTLAKEIMNDSVKEINSLSGRKLPLNCEVKNSVNTRVNNHLRQGQGFAT